MHVCMDRCMIGFGHCGSISGAEGEGIRQHADQPGRRDSGRRAAGPARRL